MKTLGRTLGTVLALAQAVTVAAGGARAEEPTGVLGMVHTVQRSTEDWYYGVGTTVGFGLDVEKDLPPFANFLHCRHGLPSGNAFGMALRTQLHLQRSTESGEASRYLDRTKPLAEQVPANLRHMVEIDSMREHYESVTPGGGWGTRTLGQLLRTVDDAQYRDLILTLSSADGSRRRYLFVFRGRVLRGRVTWKESTEDRVLVAYQFYDPHQPFSSRDAAARGATVRVGTMLVDVDSGVVHLDEGWFGAVAGGGDFGVLTERVEAVWSEGGAPEARAFRWVSSERIGAASLASSGAGLDYDWKQLDLRVGETNTAGAQRVKDFLPQEARETFETIAQIGDTRACARPPEYGVYDAWNTALRARGGE